MGTVRYSRVVAANVRRRLEALDLTQMELSKRSGVSISFLSDLVRGRANPSLRILEDLAQVLQTSVPLLLLDLDLPHGYERLVVVLPADHAAAVKRLSSEAERTLKKTRG